MLARGLGALLLLITLPSVALAEGSAEQRAAEQRSQALQAEIQQIQQQLVSAQGRETKLAAELRESEVAAAALSREEREIAAAEKAQQQQHDKLKNQQVEMTARLRIERLALAQQLRAAYLAGHSERLSLVLSQDDPALLGRVLTFHDYVSAARIEQIAAVTQQIEQLAEVKRELDTASAQLATLRQQHAQTEQRLKRQRESRAALLLRSRAEIRTRTQRLQSLEAQNAQLQQLISSLQQAIVKAPPRNQERLSSLTGLKRKLSWPVQGRIKHDFGEPRMDGKLRWRGVQIAAPRGTEVRSVAAGRVVYASWLGRHGLMMIVDHGHDYLTLYGHSETAHREVGDWVEKGEVIASVGDSGGASETGLYFEIRHKGKWRNPHDWCR